MIREWGAGFQSAVKRAQSAVKELVEVDEDESIPFLVYSRGTGKPLRIVPKQTEDYPEHSGYCPSTKFTVVVLSEEDRPVYRSTSRYDSETKRHSVIIDQEAMRALMFTHHAYWLEIHE